MKYFQRNKNWRTSLAFALVAALLLAFQPSVRAQEANESDVASLNKFAKGFSSLFKAPKTQTEATESDDEVAPSEAEQAAMPIPKDVGLVLRSPSMEKIDDAVGAFFKQTSGTKFSLLSALRLTDFRRVLATIDLDSPCAVLAFCESAPPKFAVVLPISEKRFSKFVDALAQTTPKEERVSSLGADGKTANVTIKLAETTLLIARQIDPSYVALVQASDSALLDKFTPERVTYDDSFVQLPQIGSNANVVDRLDAGLTEPVLTLEATPRGLRQLTIGSRPFWREVGSILSEVDALVDFPVAENLTEIREYVAMNLYSLRVDVMLDDFGLYFATQTVPVPGSIGSKRVASYGNLPTLNADADRFFAVLPDLEAPLSGQTNVPPLLAKSFPKPFDRLRYLEYSLSLPRIDELAAESWIFFLEVDDAHQFVEEMIIPKAREIGRYVGSKEAEELGSQLFGALAERKRDRQLNRRRPPRNIADPNQAAARGASLGGLLGGLIGESSGEEMAMKVYRFDDYPMYISDLETYTLQMRRMRAEEQGVTPNAPPTLLFNRNRPLLSALDVMLANVENGEPLDKTLLRSANSKAAQVDDSPLFARISRIVVLNDHNILLGLGNDSALRLAVNNWKSFERPLVRYQTEVHDTQGVVNLQNLCKRIPNLSETKMVGSIRLDLYSAQIYFDYLCKYYLPGMGAIELPRLPEDLSHALVVSSVAGQVECVRVVVPHYLTNGVFQACSGGMTPLELILKSKKPETKANVEEDEFEVDFEDE